MQVWAVANQKGGVGKTTTTVTLAGILADQGRRVLVIDMDPHASLSSYFGLNDDELPASVYELFQHGGAPDAQLLQRIENPVADGGLTLWPANIAMATLDRQMSGKGGMGLVLSRALQQVKNQYDHVLIDCPPVLGVLMVNAIAACDRLLIPVQTEHLALKGLERQVRTIEMMNRARVRKVPVTVVPTMFDKRTRASLDALQRLKRAYGDQVWPSVIPVDTKFRDASLSHILPSRHSANGRGVYAYKTLLIWLRQKDSLIRQEGRQQTAATSAADQSRINQQVPA